MFPGTLPVAFYASNAVSTMRLQKQLFLTLLISSALLVGLLFTFNYWSFSRGFTSYVAQKRLEPLVAELSTRYAQTGSWDWLLEADENPEKPARDKDNIPWAWQQLVGQYVFRPRPGPRPGKSNERRGKPDAQRPPPPPDRARPRRVSRAVMSLVLADSEKNLLIGQSSKWQKGWLPIEVDSDVVGYVGFRKNAQLDGLLNKAFESQQKRSFALAALALVALSALLSFPLASRFVRPIRQINNTVGEIRDGDYAARTSVSRKDELGELSSSINTMAQSLESNQEARRRWIAEISHELRTPITVLQGELEAVEDGLRPMNDDTLQGLQAQTTRLGRLVDDLHVLSMSDLGALDYRFEVVDLAGLVENYLDASRDLLQARDLQLELDIDANRPMVRVDRQRIEQLLSNVLQNTLNYTDKGGKLKVELRLVEANDAQTIGERLSPTAPRVRLVWSDSAPGVADHQLNQLFDPLFRTDDSRSRGNGGSGLGLSIVQKIISAHDATIKAGQSELGGIALTMDFPGIFGEQGG